MSVLRAPKLFLTPISRVRSVTLTSMMFIITIPPTTREMLVTGTTTAAITPQNTVRKRTHGIRRQIVEVVVFARLRVKVAAQRHARIVQRAHHRQTGPRLRPSKDGQVLAASKERLKHWTRNINRRVLALPKRRSLMLQHANHGELRARNFDGFTQRIARREKRRPNVVANHRHMLVPLFFARQKKRPIATGISRISGMM